MGRLEVHSHTHYSNLRLLDCINTPKGLVKYAQELGLAGICVTDHDCLSSHVELDKIQQNLVEQGSSFKIGHGNEIYLCDTRDSGQKYWHFILVAKNKIGYKMLKELSSIAWINSYYDRRMERVVTLKSDLERIVEKYGKGNLIASTACLGSELDYLILKMVESEKIGDTKNKQTYNIRINNLILWCKQLFDDDFYLEVQPAQSEEQLIVNNRMANIGKATNTKIIVTTDAHYLSEKDRETHTAFLNSKGGERETDSFYHYAYLQSTEEVIENLKATNLDYYELEANTLEIYDKLEIYSLANKQQVPQARNLKDYPKRKTTLGYSNLDRMYNSDNIQERYWVNQCIDKLKELNLYNEIYLKRLEEEADIKTTVGNRLNTCMFAYPIFLQQMIDTFWECGSPVGAGRGCFKSGTKILMSNGQQKNIEEVKINDYVLNRLGEIKRVENTLNYPCDEEIYKINILSSPQSIYVTNNHKFWTMEGEKCIIGDRAYCSKNCHRRCRKQGNALEKKWKRADELNEGSDYLFFPKPVFPKKEKEVIDLLDYVIHKELYVITDSTLSSNYGSIKSFNRYIPIDADFLYLLGVSIGDGWTRSDLSHFGIAFNSSTEKDLESLKRCEKILDKYNLKYSLVKSKSKNLIQLKVFNTAFANFMRQSIGNCSASKKIPSYALYDNKNEMYALFEGLQASDGSYDKKSLRISYDSINFDLISQVKTLWSYLGFYGGITVRPAHKNNKESYKIRAGGKQINWLVDKNPQVYQKKSKIQKDLIVEDEGFYVRIKKIEKENYKGKVYDLTIEGDHSYIANHVAVHNSAGAGLNHFLLGIVQVDPVVNELPFWR